MVQRGLALPPRAPMAPPATVTPKKKTCLTIDTTSVTPPKGDSPIGISEAGSLRGDGISVGMQGLRINDLAACAAAVAKSNWSSAEGPVLMSYNTGILDAATGRSYMPSAWPFGLILSSLALPLALKTIVSVPPVQKA